MNCKLIFYAARKTSFCERALQNCFFELDLELAHTGFAVDSEGLGKLVTEAFSDCNTLFIIGDPANNDKTGIVNIISRAVADTQIDDCKKLENDLGDDGYLLRAQNQLIIILPDEPEQIKQIMKGPVGSYITTVEHHI